MTLTEAPLCDGWQDDGLRVDYELRNGRVDCVLHRRVEADGKCWELEMCAPLAGNIICFEFCQAALAFSKNLRFFGGIGKKKRPGKPLFKKRGFPRDPMLAGNDAGPF